MDYLIVVSSIFFTYLSLGTIYRLFPSPIAGLPGPKLAALTLWYEFYFDVMKKGRYEWEIKKMHAMYGERLHMIFFILVESLPYMTRTQPPSDPSFASIHTKYILPIPSSMILSTPRPVPLAARLINGASRRGISVIRVPCSAQSRTNITAY
jgi:hypothetical protein